MNYKKIMSAALSATMILSSVGVLATEESVPACAMTELSELDVKAIPAYYAFDKKLDDEYAEDIKLDFGVKFEATEDEATEEFANYVVDFELSFDQDVTAILAGQYDLFDDNWISVKADSYTEDFIAGLSADVDGIDFKADKPMMIMHDSGLDDQFTYEEAVAIESFNCGIKYAYDAPEGVKATLDLCVYPTKEVTADEDHDFVKDGVFYAINRDEKIVVDSLVYEYEKKFNVPTDCAITEIPTDEAVMAIPAYEAFDGNVSAEYAEKLNLDYAVKFEATAEEAGVYANHIVDIELSFDKDVTAILAGQYDLFSNNWISVNAKEYTENVIAGLNADVDGIEFKANKPVMVMFDSGLDDQFTYEEAVAIKNFNCGIKYAYNVPNGVKATVKLCVYPSVRVTSSDEYDFVKDGEFYAILRDEKKVVSELEYVYNENDLGLTDYTTDADVVDAMNNNVDSIADAADAVGAVDLIATLAPEAQAEIAPEVIKAIVEASGADINVTEPTVFELDETVNVIVEEAADVESAFASYDDVFEVTADGVVVAPVLVAIPVADVDAVEKVLHLHEGVVEELPFVKGNGVIYVQMNKFSQIALVVNNTLVADEAELKFVARNDAPRGEAWFDLVLSGASTEVVKGFLAGEFTLKPEGTAASYAYELTAADDEIDITVNALENDAREYLINLEAFDKETSYTVVADGVTKITLAKLVVSSYGTGMINFDDVMLRRFDYDNTEENLEEAINVVKTTGAMFDIALPTQVLTVEIDFVHPTVTDNAFDYQNMWLEISGAGIDGVEKIELGNDNGLVTVEDNKYTVEKTVLANSDYMIALKGAGYRSANYAINLGEEDRTVKFWNNYKDNAVYMEFVGANGTGVKENANFLAGDIVMDNVINIYDLSAVVSYFGERGLVGVNNAYAKYDLNRDGNIDSIDVAILLTSWNK